MTNEESEGGKVMDGLGRGMAYVRQMYGVPAKRGGRVRYIGGREPQEGTILRASGAHLIIRLDGEKQTPPFHPTWGLEYL